MANRENQGLQIALIVFVMVSVAFAVLAFVYYSSAETANRKLADAEQAVSQERQKFNTADSWVQYLQHILGYNRLSEAEVETVWTAIADNEDAQAIRQAYEEDMATYGAYGEGLSEEQRSYSDSLKHLIMALQEENADNTRLAAEVRRLNNEKAEIEQSEQQRTEVAQTGLQEARDDLADQRAQFQQDRERINNEKQQLVAQYTQSREKLEEQLTSTKRNVDEEKSQVARLENTVSQQKERLTELIDEPFETADGRVAHVNQSAGSVWINLGLADGLRRQTSFSVYDQEAMNVAPPRAKEGAAGRKADQAKGKIEITRVIDQHLAEARIVESQTANPILPGDQVFSPAWKPGERVRFALVGFMDIDGDGRSDRDLIRNVITAGGGVIDAEVHEDGTVEGELNPQTRYLVRGDEPRSLADSKVRAAYSGMIDEAGQLGIQEINVGMLLDMMGYKAEVRTIDLSEGAGSGIRVTPQEGKARSSETGEFRERRPPTRDGRSAY